jgi:hypothetical protein
MNDRVPNDEELRLQNMIDTVKFVEDKLFTLRSRATPRACCAWRTRSSWPSPTTAKLLSPFSPR